MSESERIPLPSEPEVPVEGGVSLALAQLVRLPNAFTAAADILLGFGLTQRSFEPAQQFWLLIAASIGHYWAGMVFNDVFDRDIDLKERPLRPIPSGRVSVAGAVSLGVGCNLVGLALAGLVGVNSLVVAVCLTAAIYLYDGVLKKTVLGPIAMGSCRFFNVLLGASAAAEGGCWSPTVMHVASGLGVYVAGLTWFAKQEAKWSNQRMLVGAAGVISMGLAILLAFLMNAPSENDRQAPILILAAIAFTVARRLIAAIAEPTPPHVQVAIKVMLMSLVMLDAMLIVFVTGDVVMGVTTALLLVPAFVLARWIPMT